MDVGFTSSFPMTRKKNGFWYGGRRLSEKVPVFAYDDFIRKIKAAKKGKTVNKRKWTIIFLIRKERMKYSKKTMEKIRAKT